MYESVEERQKHGSSLRDVNDDDDHVGLIHELDCALRKSNRWCCWKNT